MTFDDTVKIGKRKLIEYEPRLSSKIEGTIANGEGFQFLHVDYDGYRFSCPDDISRMIETLLEKLLELPDSFWMRESECESSPNSQTQVVRHKDLCLTLSSGYTINDDKEKLVVSCWYKLNPQTGPFGN